MDQALPLWQVALYGLGTLLLSLLLAKRSQIDAWAEATPRFAGVMKLLRGFGIDPWMIAQGVVLIWSGKLPKALRPPPKPLGDDDATPTDPPRRLPGSGAGGGLLMLSFCFVTNGCASAPLVPPCDEATAAAMAVKCAARTEAECVQQGVAEEDCPVIKECEEAADRRQKECLQ